MNPYESLCYFDKRNPNGNPLPDDDDPREPRELGCACDNCFYGRDKLAVEVIRLRMALEGIKARLAMTDVPKDDWVKTLHGEIYALAAYALRDA